MTQLVYIQNFKKDTVVLTSTILNCSQSALHVTDNSHMKDVLQLTTAIVTAFSAKKKYYDSKSLKTFRRWSFSDNFTIETDDEAHISLRKQKICSEDFSSSSSLVGSKRCLEFLTL